MTNINLTFFQANFSGCYSLHSLMMVFMEIPVCPLHTFPHSHEIVYMLDDFRPKSLMVEQGRPNIFLGGRPTMLMLCLDSTPLIWLKDYWYISLAVVWTTEMSLEHMGLVLSGILIFQEVVWCVLSSALRPPWPQMTFAFCAKMDR